MPGLDGFAVLKKVLALDRRARLPQVVFATAFDQYAVKAFEVNAVDYLLKPFDGKRVVRTLEKVRARLVDPVADDVAGPTPAPELRAAPHTEPPTEPRTGLLAGAEAKLDALLKMVEEQAALSGAAPQSAPQVAGSSAGRSGKVVVRTQNRLLLVDQRDVCFASIEEGRIAVVTKALEGESNCRTLEDLADQLDGEHFWRAHRSFLVNIHHIREVVPWFKSSYQIRMDDRKQTEIPVSRSQTRRLRDLFNL
jgi:two-component system LytT family response regulator/two-component system response regulator LytT